MQIYAQKVINLVDGFILATVMGFSTKTSTGWVIIQESSQVDMWEISK